jgi:hemin uptake protein HemP
MPIDHRRRVPSQSPDRQILPVRTVSSDDLFQGSTEIAIDHAGAIYRLKITRQGKLILNK